MSFKRLLCLMLAVLFAVTVFAGCANDSGNDDETGAESGKTEETSKSEALVALDAITVDYGEEDFNISCVDSVGNSTKELKQDEQSEDVLEDAVWKRNKYLEDKCNLKYVVLPVADVASAVKNSVKSDGQIKVAFPNMPSAASLATSGTLEDFNAYEGLKLDSAWWDQGTRELVLADKVFMMNSSINWFSYDVTYLMLFSKVLAAKNNVGSLYEIVDNKEWTLDKFSELVKGVAKDLNGDGVFDKNDQYGLTATSAYGSTLFYGAGLKYVRSEMGEDLELMMGQSELEKASDLLDKIFNIYYTDNAVFEIKSGLEMDGMNMFAANQSLFYGEVASYIVNLRAMSDDFGVLPVPKYDLAQENYYTWTNGIASTMVLPKGQVADEIEKDAQILEAMAILSHEYVRPAYYDITLKSKQARDEESGPMLDIIFDHRVYDLAQYYTTLGLDSIFQNCVSSKSATFASKYESATKNFAKKVKSMTKNIK